MRRAGAAPAAARALARLSSRPSAGFWIHLDADVLDDTIMPAVDYRMRGGLSWGELAVVLRSAMAGGRAVGLDITIFNPALDADGRIARAFVRTLGAALC